jgi:hypothetical protein
MTNGIFHVTVAALVGTMAAFGIAIATAQSNRLQNWGDLLKPYEAKTSTAVPIAPPEAPFVPPNPIDLARSIAALMQYDLRCGAAPKRFMTAAGLVAPAIPQHIMNTALNNVSARYVALGQESWCAIWKHAYRNDF